MGTDDLILLENLLEEHGEKYRRLFEDALTWLATRLPKWGELGVVGFDKREFLEGLMERVHVPA